MGIIPLSHHHKDQRRWALILPHFADEKTEPLRVQGCILTRGKKAGPQRRQPEPLGPFTNSYGTLPFSQPSADKFLPGSEGIRTVALNGW